MVHRNFDTWNMYIPYSLCNIWEREREKDFKFKLYKDFILHHLVQKNSGGANALFLVLILLHCMGGE